MEGQADGPHERRELRDATGACSPTMSRVLADLEERRWTDRDGPSSELTPLEKTLAWNPERAAETASREHCRVFVHDDLPDRSRCGPGVVDDRAGSCCHDPATGALTAVIDMDSPAARE